MKKMLVLVFVLGFIVLNNACDDDDTTDNTNLTVSFANDVVPILSTHCYFDGSTACHAGTAPGNFTTYSGVFAESEHIEEHITSTDDATRMPPPYSTGPTELSTDDLNTLVTWMSEVANDNS